MVFQAEHQHLYDISPMVWFIHVREVGDPLRLARDVHAVISATSTPLLQEPPAHPTTPLPAKRLGQILGGPATVGENGVVTVDVPRAHGVVLGGIHVDPTSTSPITSSSSRWATARPPRFPTSRSPPARSTRS